MRLQQLDTIFWKHPIGRLREEQRLRRKIKTSVSKYIPFEKPMIYPNGERGAEVYKFRRQQHKDAIQSQECRYDHLGEGRGTV